MIRLTMAALLALLGSTLLPQSAKADVLEWRMRSERQYVVYVSFFAVNSNRAWPGGDQAYVLKDSDNHLFRLECRTGEKICMGASTKHEGSIWGVGPYGDGGCEDCCRSCGNRYTGVDVLQ
ncbi:MAG: hypothetical protein GY952_13535 [Rhodobacteraceae bacterium]|nr:hypothetical protein [Paracoccaceae bacterium]